MAGVHLPRTAGVTESFDVPGAGTHYADLTGEVLFMRWAIDNADDAARASGARIVHTCGFDSIPSDVGTLLLHEAARAGGHGELEETSLVVKRTVREESRSRRRRSLHA